MSDKKLEAASESSIGQSASTAGLERVAFDTWWKTITELKNEQTSESVGGFIHVRQAFEAGAMIEREACAKVCEDGVRTFWPRFPEAAGAARAMADKIRMRSNV